VIAAAIVFLAQTTPAAAISGGPHDAPRFSLSQELSYDPSDEKVEVSTETESVAFFSSDEIQDCRNGEKNEPSSTAELQSSAALYCSGGDLESSLSTLTGTNEEPGFVAVSECRFNLAMELESDMEDEESDDEDDDDDDDGHSSMLSNSSLRRSLAGANGAGGFRPPSNSDSVADSAGNRKSIGARGSMPRTHSRGGVVFLARGSAGGKGRHSAMNAALGVRGGGAISDPSEFARRLLVAALVTLMYELALGHLLEFVKIVMQTSPPGTSYGDVMRKITGEKGIAGCWDGFVPWGVVQSIFKGGVFGLAHAIASSYLVPMADNDVLPRQLALTLAGAIAGGFQGYVLSPTLLLKTRVMTNPVFRESMSLLRTTTLSLRIGIDVVKNEGFVTLMKGANLFALKRLLDWATRYFFADLFEALLLKHSASGALTTAEKAAASLLGGTASTFSTLPLDVLVAKTQDAKKAGVKVSALKLLKQDFEEKGWKGMYDSYMQGFEARLAHVCFTTVVMKTGGPVMYDLLFGKK